ncbi:unnamed protein product [Symbiodinium natans]|uniref:Uncharacterized protein n=1 Tax=Symbiodinium natans TaxID=878477 RepID=A0A812N1G3_9DINO|nr:unnamed protein product [Symbiodinium natans]
MAKKETVVRQQFRPSRCFLRFQLVFGTPPADPPTAAVFQAAVTEALSTSFGNIGSGLLQWSLLSLSEAGLGILRVRPEQMPQLRFALTMITRCGGKRCRADVLAVAPSLAALACAR